MQQRFSAERFLGIELEVHQRLEFGPTGHWRALRLELREGLADVLSAVTGPDAVESCMRATKP